MATFYPNVIRPGAEGVVKAGPFVKEDGTNITTYDADSAFYTLLRVNENFDSPSPLLPWTAATDPSSGVFSATVAADLTTVKGVYRVYFKATETDTSLVRYLDAEWAVAQSYFQLTTTIVDVRNSDLQIAEKTGLLTDAVIQKTIAMAYSEVWAELKGINRWPWLIFNSHDLNHLVRLKTLEMLCLGNTKADDIWFQKQQEYKEKYLKEWHRLAIIWDRNYDAIIDDTNGLRQGSTIR